MGEVLGLGVTHWPVLCARDEQLTTTFRYTLQAPAVPDHLRDSTAWPSQMLEELGSDEGVTAARAYAERLADDFRWARNELESFDPDFVVVFGDDQYENFREEIIPPFCIFGLDDLEVHPWRVGFGESNRWGEAADFALSVRGHRAGARHLATELLGSGFDLPYSYALRDPESLPHAFLNTVLFLDWDRAGFPWPLVPFAVNCYGSEVLTSRGGFANLFRDPAAAAPVPDPPSPSPKRCMELGAALADAAVRSPWRIALVASASWSHAFLTPRHGYLWSDIDADRVMLQALEQSDWDVWRSRSVHDIEESGQHEMLNWMILAGAMERLGRSVEIRDYVESHVFTSQKCFAVFRP